MRGKSAITAVATTTFADGLAAALAAARMLLDWMLQPVRMLLANGAQNKQQKESTVPVDEEPDAEEFLVLDEQDHQGDTPLHCAVKMALGNLLGKEPLIEEMDPQGWSKLDACLRNRSIRVVEGYEISQLAAAQHLHNKRGLMPIHIAAGRGNAPVCEALLKAGAPINARSERTNPLVHGHFCRPPQWGRRNKNGELTAVEVADKTPLHVAVGLLRDQHEMDEGAASLDTTLVRLLLSYGADCNAIDFHGQTPFDIAVSGGMHELVAMLADAGADLSMSCRSFGQFSSNTALHLATLLKDARMVKLLTDRGAPVDAIGRDGWTPLCLAARSGAAEVAKALLAAGADVFAVSGNGKHALEIALINCKNSKTVRESGVLEVLQREVAAAVLEIAYSRLSDPVLVV